jgi:Ca2+-binding EF-hand superfamily protein
MRTNIRFSLVAALAAVAVSAASAAAAPPAWYGDMDRNRDGFLTWSEYVRNDRAFEVMDENGDMRITKTEGFGNADWKSSWDHVASFDADGNGSVTHYEYQRGVRNLFDSVDVNRDGAINETELSGNA